MACEWKYSDLSECDEQASKWRCDVKGALAHELIEDRLQAQDPLQEILRHGRVVVRVRMTDDRGESIESGVKEFFILLKVLSCLLVE